MRGRLLPLDKSGRSYGRGDEAGFVFTNRPLVENLHALLLREDVEALQQERRPVVQPAQKHCSLTDVARFIDGSVDDILIERWLRGFVLVGSGVSLELPRDTIRPPASFAVLSIVHHRRLADVQLPRTGGFLARACGGDAEGASELAIRRLNASARPFPVSALVEPAIRMRRIAAALAFPLTVDQRRVLESTVLPAIDETITNRTTLESKQEQA
jgi:CRISPR-associated protein Csx17